MGDDYGYYGDTDPNNIPDGDDGGDQDVTSVAPAPSRPASAGEGLPGFRVDGHPAWRAGVLGPGRGLLGMARLSDLVARPGDDATATLQLGTDQAPMGSGDQRLQRVSDPVLDQEQNSWRWNDPDALAYDIDRKKRQLADAQALSYGAFGGSVAQQGVADLAKAAPPVEALGFPSPLAWTGIALGGYMGFLETPRLENEIKALQSRLNEIETRSKT